MHQDVIISGWIDAPELQPAGREFVIGDVHGMSAGLEKVLQAMGNAAAGVGNGHLTLLGDLIDRGPDPLGALAIAAKPPEAWGFDAKTLVVGNHDLFLMLALDCQRRMTPHDLKTASTAEDCLRVWSYNGARTLFDDLGIDYDVDLLRDRLTDRIGIEAVAQIEAMTSHRSTGNITMTHAGPGWRLGIPNSEWFAASVLFEGFISGNEDHYTWTRWWWTREPTDPGFVVHGHTKEQLFHDVRNWQPDIHRLDGVRLGLDGGGSEDEDRMIVGAEIEAGRYRIYSAPGMD
jgi:hypothetical protein